MRERFEYWVASALLRLLTWMPRGMAAVVCRAIGRGGYIAAGRLRCVAYQNLSMALPQTTMKERRRIVRRVFLNLARLLTEFSQFPKLNPQNISRTVIYDGFENYTQAKALGKGVLILTAHFGAWELSSFAHSVYGHPMRFLVRPLDNSRVDALIMAYRGLRGNRGIGKHNSLREIIRSLRDNESVGILIDQNTTREEGVFVDFFGIPACTTAGVATLALRTGAVVLPGFLIWDERLKKHRLRFEPMMEIENTGDFQHDVVRNTEKFNRCLEEKIRQHPDQWLWIHRRWKTRPEGAPPLYP